MKKDLLYKFEEDRNSIINSIFDVVNNQPNKSISLKSNIDYRIDNSEDINIIAQKYNKLFIEKDDLMIEYEYGEGFEPYEFEKTSEPLCYLSANEIYEVIQGIEENNL